MGHGGAFENAIAPNLVQTWKHAGFIHGPFANIAHGCQLVSATTTALSFGLCGEKPASAPILAEKLLGHQVPQAGSADGRHRCDHPAPEDAWRRQEED